MSSIIVITRPYRVGTFEIDFIIFLIFFFFAFALEGKITSGYCFPIYPLPSVFLPTTYGVLICFFFNSLVIYSVVYSNLFFFFFSYNENLITRDRNVAFNTNPRSCLRFYFYQCYSPLFCNFKTPFFLLISFIRDTKGIRFIKISFVIIDLSKSTLD